MSFTPTGVIIIIIGLIVFLYSTKWLYAFAVFFVPFSATAVVSVGDPLNGSSVQPYMFFAILFIVRYSYTLLSPKTINLNSTDKYLLFVKIFTAAFGIISAISLIMPLIINGKVNGNIGGIFGDLSPIVFTNRNITQYLYFLLGLLFAFFGGKYASKPENLIFGIKVFSYSILFVSTWAIFEFICAKTGIPYPSGIFNNSAGLGVAHGTSTYGYSSIIRLQSVCVEPSIFAQQLVAYLPFLFVGLENNFKIFTKYKDIAFSFLIGLLLLMSISSSAIISLTVLLFLFVLTKRNIFTKGFTKLILYTAIIILLMLVVYAIIPDIINLLLFDKSETGSAIERLSTITDGWENFKQYPILGVGWGTVTVYDFFVKILSNTGIMGGLLFFTAIVFIILQHSCLSKEVKENYINTYLNRACLLSFIILLINCEVAGFSFYFGTFWLILGFCMAQKNKYISI